jgi:hypothetical protein
MTEGRGDRVIGTVCEEDDARSPIIHDTVVLGDALSEEGAAVVHHEGGVELDVVVGQWREAVRVDGDVPEARARDDGVAGLVQEHETKFVRRVVSGAGAGLREPQCPHCVEGGEVSGQLGAVRVLDTSTSRTESNCYSKT